MTLHKLTSGDGYTYLTRQVGSADQLRHGQGLAAYYTESGNPPGRWIGAGAADLGVAGEVSEAQMRALFGRGMHPDADRIITTHIASGMTSDDADRLTRLGRKYPDYRTVVDEDGVVRQPRRAVAGYDLVFTPVKSVSLLWALGDWRVRAEVEAAHHDAVADAIGWLEQNAIFTRIGDRGEYQLDTHGLIAAAFDHRESRLGDPDLHTHVAIANKVRAFVSTDPPGRERWLAIDGTTLYAAAVAASERYNTRLEHNVARRLGVVFVPRVDTVRRDERPVREVAGIPVELIKAFSRRRGEIEQVYHELLRAYRTEHGHEPPRDVQLRLAQQATLETRESKPEGRRFADQLADWRNRAAELLGGVAHVDAMIHAAIGASIDPFDVDDAGVDAIARSVLAVLQNERSTWTRWNMLAEVERQIRPHRPPAPRGDDDLVARVVARATAPDRSLRIVPLQLALPDEELVRRDGTPAAVPHACERYTTRAVLDSEQALLSAARERTRLAVPRAHARTVIAELERHEGWTLDNGQRALAETFTGDDRRLVVGIGPAGAGKTTALHAACAVWESAGRRVVPLATSAKAAEVLAEDLGRRAENMHKFLHELSRAGPRVDPFYTVNPGDVLLVDEAGMAGTLRLCHLTELARIAGAQVRLVGDPWQLGAVESGGALRLLVHDVGAVELTQLHRFRDPEEANATLRLRAGDAEAIGFYQQNDRIRSGSREAMLDSAYEAWRADLLAGRDTVLVAATNQEATALNIRARTDRIGSGDVSRVGVGLHDGSQAGVGDWIITRRNLRTATAGERDFVKNGDRWQVVAASRDGGLLVQHLGHGGRAHLPAAYVQRDVELGYAATAYRVQGATVDTAHVLVTDETTRETLYVAASRARDGTHLYLATETLVQVDTERPQTPPVAPSTILETALTRTAAERSATETIRLTQPEPFARPSRTQTPTYTTGL